MDPSPAQLRGGGAGESELRVLGRRVGARRGKRDRAGHRDDVHDVGASHCLESRQERAQGPHGAQVIHAQDLLEPFRVDRGKAGAAPNAGVVHEQMNLRMMFQNGSGHPLDVFAA